jgi:hypothetical protein
MLTVTPELAILRISLARSLAQEWEFCLETGLRFPVTGRTERTQMLEIVRSDVGLETAIRNSVMNIELPAQDFLAHSTFSAGKVVTFPRRQ